MYRGFAGWAAAPSPRAAGANAERIRNTRIFAQSWGQVPSTVNAWDVDGGAPSTFPPSPLAVSPGAVNAEVRSVITELVERVIAAQRVSVGTGVSEFDFGATPNRSRPRAQGSVGVSGDTNAHLAGSAQDGAPTTVVVGAAIPAQTKTADALPSGSHVVPSSAKSGPVGPAQVSPIAIAHPHSYGDRPTLWRPWAPWFAASVETVRAAEGQAALLAVPTNGESVIPYLAELSWFTRFKYSLSGKHAKYHRASNKLYKRLTVLRELRDRMIYAGVGHKRVRTDLNVAAAEEVARKVIREDLESDSPLLSKGEECWYKRALVEVYFIKDDDESFLELLGRATARAGA